MHILSASYFGKLANLYTSPYMPCLLQDSPTKDLAPPFPPWLPPLYTHSSPKKVFLFFLLINTHFAHQASALILEIQNEVSLIKTYAMGLDCLPRDCLPWIIAIQLPLLSQGLNDVSQNTLQWIQKILFALCIATGSIGPAIGLAFLYLSSPEKLQILELNRRTYIVIQIIHLSVISCFLANSPWSCCVISINTFCSVWFQGNAVAELTKTIKNNAPWTKQNKTTFYLICVLQTIQLLLRLYIMLPLFTTKFPLHDLINQLTIIETVIVLSYTYKLYKYSPSSPIVLQKD